jgi:hypothetical protein
MFRPRPTRIRGLTFCRTPAGVDLTSPALAGDVDDLEQLVHARSRFRSLTDPDLSAIYAVHELGATLPTLAGPTMHHTLMVVREFRRVPLDASALALALFRARGGQVAQAIAALAHWAERAVSLAEPAYLLVAHSLEEPRLIVLLTGVHECDALLASRRSAFSIESLLDDATAFLMDRPEWFAYCAPQLAEARVVSPSAV